MGKVSGGDTILLESGNYGSVDFKGLGFSDYVTITSADGSDGAIFEDIGVYNSSYLRIDGVHVSNSSNGGSATKLVTIEDQSHHVEFVNSEVHGKVDGNYTGHYGIYTLDSDSIKISNNNVHDVKIGILSFATDNIEVSENFVDKTGSDGYKFGGNVGFLIENNSHGGKMYGQPGAHLDFMQFQGHASDGVIRGNLFLPETPTSETAQGIFLADAAFHNILIEENIIYTAMANGIRVGIGSDIVARNNTVLNAPDLIHKATGISLPEGSVMENNIFSSYKGGVSGSNVKAQHNDSNKDYHYDDLFVNATEGLGTSLEDLMPVEGSAAEGKGAYVRLMKLMVEGWESTSALEYQ
jgi:parallel beta-helix repeat protein